MACPVSIGDAQQVVHLAVTIYRKIQNAEDEIKEVGTKMERLDSRLVFLRRLIVARSATANQLDPHWRMLLDRITQCMVEIRKVSQGIYSILKIYYDNGSLSKYLFPFGRNPKSLRALMEKLKNLEKELKWELASANLLPSLPASTGAGGVAVPPFPVLRPLTPTPKPAKKNCSIIFVDLHNSGRSKVSEAYTNLVRGYVLSSGGACPLKFPHSAGMSVKHMSNCAETLQNLKPPVGLTEGNKAPVGVAMESVFDNKHHDYPGKIGLRETMTKSRSRGINDTIFQKYDYILVFVQREFRNLLALKKALISAKGQQIAPNGKGRIIHLGAYISKDGNPVTIPDPKKGDDGTHSRAEWNKTTGKIKLAIKGFLKEELEWVQPAKS